MKKILFKSGHTGFGGVERVQTEFINYLHSINADFKVVLDKDFAEQNVTESILKCPAIYLKNNTETVEFENAKTNKNKSFLHKIKYNLAISKDRKILKREFAKVVNDFKPEITINFHDSYYFNLALLKKTKNIVWVHSSIVSAWRPHKKALKYIKQISKYDLIVCVSKGIMEQIIEFSPELKNKTTYLYNPINFERIKKLSDDEFSDEEKELVSKKFLLMVSRLDLGKDFETLFRAFDLAKENGYDEKLYVIGDGNEKDIAIIKKFLNDVKYKDEIKLLGGKTNPFNWMKKCDKFILSSNFEGLPTVLLEALTVNDTVISSDCKSGPKEILDSGKIGYLFTVGNAEELAKLMIEAKPKNRNEIDLHLSQFSTSTILSQFNSILEKI